MKIRNGFVSNSSSTSFIVALNNSVPCPHCGRCDKSIIDMIETAQMHSSETEMRWSDPRDFLIDTEKEIESYDKELREYRTMDPNSMGGYQNRYKISTLMQWTQDSIAKLTKLMGAIQDAQSEGKQVIKFDADYHDDLLNDIIREQIESGTIEVIEEHG